MFPNPANKERGDSRSRGSRAEATDTGYGRFMGRLSRYAGVRVFRFFTRALGWGARAAPLAEVQLRILCDADFAPLYADAELDLSPEGVANASSRGDLCVGAYDGRTLAGYCWLAFRPAPLLDGVWIHVAPDAVWTYKSFVRPCYRGRRIAPALYRFGDAVCTDRGRTFSIIGIETYNRPSLAAAERAGYAPAGHAGYMHGRHGLVTWCSADAAVTEVRFCKPAAEPPAERTAASR